MAATATVNVRAELAGLRRDLQSAGDLTEGQAQAMVISLEKRLKAAEKAAKATAKASKEAKDGAKDLERAEREASRGIEALGKALAEQFGGPISKLADLSTNTAGAIGVLGASAFAAVGAVGALALGAKGLADSAVEARDRLLELGADAEIPAASLDSLAAYEAASGELQKQIDLLTVAVGSELADALTDVALLAADVVRVFGEWSAASEDLTTWVGTVTDAAQGFARVGTAIGSLGLSELFLAQADAAREAADATRHLEEALSDETDMLLALGIVSEDDEVDLVIAARARERAAQASRDRAKALREEQQAEAEAAKERDRLVKQIEEEQRQIDAYTDKVAMAEVYTRRWAEAEARAVTASSTLDADLRDLNETLAEAAEHLEDTSLQQGIYLQLLDEWANGEAVSTIVTGIGQITDAIGESADRQIEELQRVMEQRREAIREWKDGELEKIDAMVESGEISEKQAILEKRRIAQETKQKREELEKQTAAQQEAALKAWKQNQATQKAMAIVEGARAAIAALAGAAALGPIAAGIAVTGAGAATLAAIAAIDSAEPPEFPMGRVPTSTTASPDHARTVRVRDDEGILSPRGTAAVGGPAAVEALNRGTPPGPSTVVVQLDGRDFARAVLDRHGRASPTPGSWAAGRRPLYGGR